MITKFDNNHIQFIKLNLKIILGLVPRLRLVLANTLEEELEQ